MARTGAFTNWNTLSGSTTQAPSVTEAVNITMPDGLTVYNYASKAITYRTVAYTARLKSIGPIVTQLGNGQGRVTIRLHNGDLDFRDSVEGYYVTSAGSTVFTGMEDFSGALITVRRILTGVVSSTPTSTDLIYMFGRVTGSRYSEDYFELDCVTDVNLAPVLSNRRVGAKCAWVFKGTECGYSGGLTTCNKLYTDSGGCSGRSNQHRFGGFPVRDSAATIGKVTGLGSAATYQLVQSGTTYQEQRMITAFDDSFGVVDDSGNDRTVVTAITPDWINAQSTTYKASGSTTTTTGSITSGTATLTVASASSWKVGQGIRIAGAGAAGAALTTTISAISGTTFTLATNASTTVSSAAIGHDDTVAVQAALDAGPNEAREIQTDNSGVLFARVTPTESTDYNPVKYDPALADAYVNVRQYTGTSVTIGSLPAISGTVTANVPLVSNTPVNQMQALPVVLITDEGTGAYDTGQQLPVEIKTIATSVTIGSLPAISGTVTVGNSVTIGSLPAISGTVTVGNSVTIGSLPAISGTVTVGAMPNGSLTTRFGTPTTANTAFATSAVTNASRKYLLIQNVTTGSNVITVGIGFTPTTTQGIQLTAGAGITFESSYIPTGAVYVLSSVTASNFTVLEA